MDIVNNCHQELRLKIDSIFESVPHRELNIVLDLYVYTYIYIYIYIYIYTRYSFSLILLKMLWSFQKKNKKITMEFVFRFRCQVGVLFFYLLKNISAHLVSPFLLFQLALWSRACLYISCCFYWWNFWILRHEEIFVQFNYQEAVTKSCFYPIIGDHLLCRTFKWLFLNYSRN